MKIDRVDCGERCRYKVWNEYQTHIIGTATVKRNKRPLVLENINVHRNRRDNGIGSELLQKVISDYEDSTIIAWVFDDRVDWYKRHGFTKEKETEELVKMSLYSS